MIYNELIERGTADFPISLYHVDKNHPRYEMSSHWHTEIEIIRIITGKLRVKLNSNEYITSSGDIIFVNPQTVHGAIPIEDCYYECIVMKLDILNTIEASCRFFIDSLLNHEIHINELNSEKSPCEFKAAANSFFESLSSDNPGCKFTAISSLYALMAAVVNYKMYSSAASSHIPNDKSISKLKNVLSYIRNNYSHPITLKDMAEHAGMSQKYFCSFFKEMTTKTPMEYLILYRIECSARKLLVTGNNVTDIALSCGFNDLSYFIKTFKRIKGVTPAKFRQI